MTNKSITVTIQLFAQYRENRFKVKERVYPSGTTAQDIIDELGFSEYELNLGVLMINFKHEKKEYVLQEGDILALFPEVGGG